jgi:hypothetical protein
MVEEEILCLNISMALLYLEMAVAEIVYQNILIALLPA